MPKKSSKKKGIEEVERLEREQIKELRKMRGEEERIETGMRQFEKEMRALKEEVKPEVVEKFTLKDVARGIVGAIFGMSIMGWHDGVRQAALKMPIANVILIIFLTIIAGAAVLYFSQYKRIKERWIIHKLLPKRFVIFYILSLAIVFLVYSLFSVIQIGVTPPKDMLRLVFVIGLPAMIGASTADVIR